MKNIVSLAILAMAMVAGVSSCSKDEENDPKKEEVKEITSDAQDIVQCMMIKHGCYFKKVHRYYFTDVENAGEPNSISLFIENIDNGCYVYCEVIQDYWMAYKFEEQYCEGAYLKISSTGKKNEIGEDIKNVEIYIPKMYDTDGRVVENVWRKYEGSVEDSNMLEY